MNLQVGPRIEGFALGRGGITVERAWGLGFRKGNAAKEVFKTRYASWSGSSWTEKRKQLLATFHISSLH